MEERPLVSICCITYNHINYIREAIEGFLMQKTNFPIEIIIHDDASTDGTTDIIREYEAKHPGLIKPIYQTENQWSLGIKPSLTYVWPKAQGRYIALCEGDDYWTDPLKLQKQVNFLEENRNFSLVCSRYKIKQMDNPVLIPDKFDNLFYNNISLLKIRIEDIFQVWLTQTLTVLMRRSDLLIIENILQKYNHLRDTHLFYHILKMGEGGCMNEFTGVYRIHRGGVYSMVDDVKRSLDSFLVYKELFAYNFHDPIVLREYFLSRFQIEVVISNNFSLNNIILYLNYSNDCPILIILRICYYFFRYKLKNMFFRYLKK